MTSAAEAERRFRLRLGLVAVAAAAVRLAYVLLVKRNGEPCDQELCGDALYYGLQAKLNAAGHWFQDPQAPGWDLPAADHPPLTALTVTPAARLFEDSVLAQRLTMTLIGVAAVVVIGLLGRRVAGDRTGLLAAGLAALYPNLWVNDGLVMAESLTALLVASVLLSTYRFHDDPTWARAALLGGLCGLAMLARAEQALLVPVIVLPVALSARSLPLTQRLARFGVVAAVAVAVIAPWSLWNLSRFSEPVLLSTNDGLTLLGANCDEVYSGPGVGYWRLDCGLAVTAEGDQSETSRARRQAAFDYVSDHLSRIPSVMAIRVGRTWSLYAPNEMVWLNQGEGREPWVSWAGFWMYLALLPLGVGGAVVLWRRGTMLWPLVGTAVIVTATAALFYGLLRFRIPAEVALVVLAAVALDALGRRYVDPARRPAP